MPIAALGQPLLPSQLSSGWATAHKPLRTEGASHGGASHGIGLAAVGAVGVAAGLSMRAHGLSGVGTTLAAISGVLFGASLLTGCTGAAAKTNVPGDEGPAGSDLQLDDNHKYEIAIAGADSTNPAPKDYVPASAARDAREGVVEIRAELGQGSGWVAQPGRVITNYHVAQGSTKVTVTDHEGTKHAGTVLKLDRTHDLALIDAPDLADAPLAMDDTVETGEAGETTGYPNGAFDHASAYAASMVGVTDDGRHRDAIMFVGKSDHGVSGGAVINGSGEVIATSFAVGTLGTSDIVLGIPNEHVREFLDS